MQQTRSLDLFATGMAIFAMFFGAGNIIYPLALGQQTLEQTPYGIIGFLLTAVIVPFSGLLAMFLYQGRVQPFFGRLGSKTGLALAFFIIALLGPLGSTPRCIALSYSTLNLAYPGLDSLWFNGIASLSLFLMAYKKQYLLNILGYILTPFLLLLLVFIIVKGFWIEPREASSLSQLMPLETLWKGLKDGYNTMDLLAAFFFAPVIIKLTQQKTAQISDPKERLYFVLKASGIGGLLLSLIYIGFCLLSARHSVDLYQIQPAELLGAMSMNILGPFAGFVVCFTVVLACLTTAVALIAAFAGFVHEEILGGKWNYPSVLALSVSLTFLVACFEFQGITQFLTPILEISYPFLIALTAYHLVEQLYLQKGIAQSCDCAPYQ